MFPDWLLAVGYLQIHAELSLTPTPTICWAQGKPGRTTAHLPGILWFTCVPQIRFIWLIWYLKNLIWQYLKWASSPKNLAIWSRSFGAYIPMGQKFCWMWLGSGCPFRAGKPRCGFATVPAIPYCTPSLDSLTDKICLAHIATSVGNPHLSYFCVTFESPGTILLLLLARMQKPICLGK